MRSNAGMANRQGTSTCASRKSPPPVRTLARLGWSYRPISLLDTIGKLLAKRLLSNILCEVIVLGLLRNEQFGIRPKHSTALQLARLVERVSRNHWREDWQAQFSWMWLSTSILYGSTVSSTNSQSSIFPRTFSRPYHHTWRDGRSNRASKQPHQLVVACGVV